MRDQFQGLNDRFFDTWVHAPFPPLFVSVPATALTSAQPLPSALTTWLKIA